MLSVVVAAKGRLKEGLTDEWTVRTMKRVVTTERCLDHLTYLEFLSRERMGSPFFFREDKRLNGTKSKGE